MSNEPDQTKPIPCPQGCGRRNTNIGKRPVTLEFRFVPRNRGKILDITGLDEPPFSNKRFVDPDFLVDYAGTGPDLERWSYRPVSEPACPPLDDAMVDEDPELTNEPEG